MLPPIRTLSAAMILILASTSTTVEAQGCPTAPGQPAPTLLFPYFEVDLAEPLGMTTLLSIGNASDQRVIAQVVVWTNLGEPVLSFSLYLLKGAIQPVNLRDVITQGELPDTFPEGPLPPISCRSGALSPTMTQDQRAALEARLLGLPDPRDGLCYARPPRSGRLATGYVTVDLMATCPQTVRSPLDPGYFDTDDRPGLAVDDKALVGDLIFIDGNGNQARGIEAVPVMADSAFFEDNDPLFTGFYRTGNRLGLGTRYMTRFFNGGAFDGGTELIVWTRGPSHGPQTCPDVKFVTNDFFIMAEVRNEAGVSLGTQRIDFDRQALRIKVGDESFPLDTQFGSLGLDFYWDCPQCSPSEGVNQAWVMPVHTADGRFSIGLNAVQRCDP